MTIISNTNKSIKFTLSNNVNIEKEANEPASYVPEMPIILFNNADDALYAQKEINTYVSNLLNNMVKNKGGKDE